MQLLTVAALRDRAGETEFALGQALLRRALVRETRKGRDEVDYVIAGDERHSVHVTATGAQCDCGAPYCRHSVAAALLAIDSGAVQEMEKRRSLQSAPALFEAVASMLPETDDIRLQPTLFLQKDGLHIGLRMGEDRLYVVRHIPRFLQCMEENKPLPFGKGFEYRPQWMRFDENQMRLLDILAEYCESTAIRALPLPEARLLLLTPRVAVRVLDALMDVPFRLVVDNETYDISGVEATPLPLNFHLSGTPRQLSVKAELPRGLQPLTRDAEYVLLQGCRVLRVPREQQALLRTLLRFAQEDESDFAFTEGETPRVMSELLPFLLRAAHVSIEPDLEKQMVRLPFKARVYLDKEGTDVVARAAFAYGDYEIDPFSAEQKNNNMLLLRDIAGERALMDELAREGFHVRRGRVYLHGQDKIFDFVTAGASRLTQCAEVYFSKDFRRLTPRKPQFQGMLVLKNGKLSLQLKDGDTPLEELLPLLEALQNRRRYFRYKDGEFLDLSDVEAWQPLAEAVLEGAEGPNGVLDLGVCRTAYLSALSRACGLPVSCNEEAQNAAELRFEAPPSPLACLRPYQQRGFEWLCALHALGMGGILADDMGLGKTIQMIAALMHYTQAEPEWMPSLIVSPTSLTYNWQSEFTRFAPNLRVMLLSGAQAARAEQLQRLQEDKNIDVLITSYPLIRRDIALMSDIPFRFAVLDEAQQVKNVQSVGAHAVKQLTAQTRIALTGTPMENHAGELWSLFDFVLPGYLPRYTDFLRRYGEGQNAADLRRRIRPFLMRRLKADVLAELPERLESILMADLPPEQRRVYDAALLQKRERVGEILRVKGMAKGRAEVLSAITELRQICCHPALCLPDYPGLSSKLELLMDVLPAALLAGRRILVFSQFTTMLRLIEKRLRTEGIANMYLDGETPAAERLQLVQRFNGGEADVFLISLKAGGTGLNLTGADMVIHYDPWWNPTAEEQATGRAHRIGQTKRVEVVRLVVHDSIEEQVLRMSDRKRRLFDRLITPGEEMPTRLTEKDILALFDGQ